MSREVITNENNRNEKVRGRDRERAREGRSKSFFLKYSGSQRQNSKENVKQQQNRQWRREEASREFK